MMNAEREWRSPPRRTLYPEAAPYRSDRLRVSSLHELYYEEVGNPRGKPVIFLHGGPGSGLIASHRRYFDPARYRVVLLDQRGAGRSTPYAELRENTTWHLVDDLEVLRRHLGISRWQIFGGSWGSTLAIAYAEACPERVTELVLRGIFLLQQDEIDWFYQGGAGALFPEAWDSFVQPIPEGERGDLIRAYHDRLTSPDEEVRLAAARAWSAWEGRTSLLIPDPHLVDFFTSAQTAVALARIECHYMLNKGFLRRPGQLVEDLPRIADIPGIIVHGRYDAVCPARSAVRLHRGWPRATLRIVPDAGHSALEPGIVHELVTATDRFADQGE